MLRKVKDIIFKMTIRGFDCKKGNKLKVMFTWPPRSGTSFLCGLVVRMDFDKEIILLK